MAEKKGSSSEKTLYCSFCGKSQHEVKKLIAGPSVFVCDECIDLCNEIIRDELPAGLDAGETRGDLPTPLDIKTTLDSYVIGQEPAKRTLAVAVYNHYKRLRHKEKAKKDDVELTKSNILLIGPTGSGKTLLAQTLARTLNVPFVMADATNILFICGGAFSGLEKVIESRTETSGIGFGAAVKSKKTRSLTESFKDVEPEDLIKFGLIPELVGRMPVVATLAELGEDALVQILTEPKNAVVKQFSKLLAMEGVDLEIRPSALKAIARKALARKTGARGLRSILEQSLIDTMFDLPSTSNVDKVVVDESTIEENKAPLLVYREVAKKA